MKGLQKQTQHHHKEGKSVQSVNIIYTYIKLDDGIRNILNASILESWVFALSILTSEDQQAYKT